MSSLFFANSISISRLSSRTDIANWNKIFKLVTANSSIVDRAGTFKQPVNIGLYSGCQLPVLQHQSLTYRDCCDLRTKELWNHSNALQKPLGLLWSGGIDSTLMIVNFLENYNLSEAKDKIKIITSEEAVIENTQFYRDHILPNFELVNAEKLPWLYDKECILVDGEMNDQLFGPGMIRTYMLKHPDAFTRPISKSNILNYVEHEIGDQFVAEILVDAVISSSETYGIRLEKDIDWFWWWNFCFKWQSTWFVKLTLCAPRFWHNINENFIKDYMFHYFDTFEFQLWCINNPEARVLKKWTDHKLLAKQEIFNFDKNEVYLNTKVKRGSLKTLFNQRILFEGIDNNFKIIEKINPEDWYIPGTLFNKE